MKTVITYDDYKDALLAELTILSEYGKNGQRAKIRHQCKDITFRMGFIGEEYFDQKDIKLLVIGRASGEYFVGSEDEKMKDSVIHYNESNNPEKHEEVLKACFEKINEPNGLSWLNKLAPGKHRTHCNTPFFRLIGKTYAHLTDPKLQFDASNSDLWREKIAYTNLYKFLPMGGKKPGTELIAGGNPKTALKRAQENNFMATVLRLQLKDLQPTHILLIVAMPDEWSNSKTDYNWYPDCFKKEIDDYVKEKNRTVQVIISPRPESRKSGFGETAIIERIKQQFSSSTT